MINRIPKKIKSVKPQDVALYLENKSFEERMFRKYQGFFSKLCNQPKNQDRLGIPLGTAVVNVNPAGYSFCPNKQCVQERGYKRPHDHIAIVADWHKLAWQLRPVLLQLDAIEEELELNPNYGRFLLEDYTKHPERPIAFFSLTKSIDASTGSNGIRNTAAASWSDAINGNANGGVGNFVAEAYGHSSIYECARWHSFFNLVSVVPGGSKVKTGSKLVHPLVSGFANTYNLHQYICSSTATDPVSSYTDPQFMAFGNEKTWGNILWSALSLTVTTDIPFTTDGIAAIVVNAINKFGLRNEYDIDATSPADNATGNSYNAAVAGIDMVVVYTPPAGFLPFFMT